MPQKRKTKEAEVKDLVTACQQQVEDVWSRVPVAGCTLHRYMYGELSKEDSDKMIVESFEIGGLVPTDIAMSDGEVPDLLVRNSQGEIVALIEATGSATIDVLDHSVTQDVELFAQEWENERPQHKQQLRDTLYNLGLWPYGFTEVVTIVEA